MCKKIFLYTSVLFIIAAMVVRCYYEITDDFQVKHISYDLPYHPEWNVSDDQLDGDFLGGILNQKLTYLGKGAQCYVFGTEDENYVIKFIKFKHHKVEKYEKWKWVPFYQKTVDAKIEKHKRKLNAVFSGYVTAFEKLKASTGLVALHLNKTGHLNKKITVVDKIGFQRGIDLDSVSFIIQKKAVVTEDLVKSAIFQNSWDEVENLFIQLIDFLQSEYQMGLLDRDRSILTNTGFVNGRPVHIDTGKLTENSALIDPVRQFEEFDQIFIRLKKWIRIKNFASREKFVRLIDERLYPYAKSVTLQNSTIGETEGQ